MKYSFHVSAMPIFWTKGLSRKYIAEPYVADYYDLTPSKDVIVADFTRKNKQDYINDNKYLSIKVEKYRVQIIKNLNKLHQVNYSSEFWTKALGMGFIRFVHMVYDGYKTSSLFNSDEHTAYILDKNSYQHFQDFEEFRTLFQNDNFGYEQMFSLYMHTFYPEIYQKNKIKVEPERNSKTLQQSQLSFITRLRNITIVEFCKRIIRFILSQRRPAVGVFHSFFSNENRYKLFFKSFGKIGMVKYDYGHRIRRDLNFISRKILSKDLGIEDKFDQFFEKALECFFPTLYVESFHELMKYFQKESTKYKNLTHIVSEAWIGNSRMSFFIAVLQQHGIRHIYNEHNYMEHFLLGNHIDQLAKMCDQYYTLGWQNKHYKNIYKGASLFPFSFNKSIKKDMDYLYIGSLPIVKMAEINCAYGEQQENSLRYIKYIEHFYSHLSQKVMGKLIYRPYPNQHGYWLQYNIQKRMEAYMSNLGRVDDFLLSSKEMMAKSKLVIIDYLSTAYIEALSMNVPMVILLDYSRYYMASGYEDFFEDLIKVGICQTDPKKAAEFINDMDDNIEEWWTSCEVQAAKQKFLDTNIGNPEDAITFYLSLLDNDIKST